jgi:PAS domain S-box-containing protein
MSNNNEQTSPLRAVLKDKAEPGSDVASRLHEEISLLNNELVNSQREAAKANCALKAAHDKLLEMNRSLEESVQERAAEARDLYNNAPIGYHSVNEDGLIVMMNQAELDWLGYRREELVGVKFFRDLLTPSSRQSYEEQFPRYKARGWIKELEIDIVRRDGGIVPASLDGNVVYDADGTFVRTRSIVKDMTERRKSELVLRESEEQFRQMFERHSGIMLLIEPDSGAILAANQSAQTYYGYSLETLKQMKVQDLNTKPPEEVAELRRQAVSQEISTFLFTHRLASGEVRPVEVYSSPITVKGKAILFSIIHDIAERKWAEHLLAQSERQMRALVGSLDDIVFEVDEQGTFLNVWAANESPLAKPRAEMVGRRVPDVLGEEVAAPFLEAFKRVLASGRCEDIEYPLKVIGGHRWFMARISPVGAPEGAGRTISMLVRDISERKRAEAILKESEARFREVLENSLAASYKRNLKAGVYEYLSPVWERISGYTPEEMKHLSVEAVAELMHPDDEPEVQRVVTEALSSSSTSCCQVEYRFKHKADGQYIWLHDEFVVMREAQGAPVAMIGSVSNITARRLAEVALKESEARLAESQRIAHVGSWELDVGSHVLTWSDESFRMFGFRKGEFSPTMEAFFECVHPDDRPTMNATTQAAWYEGKPFDVEHRIIRPDGQMRTVHEMAEIIFDDAGQPARMIGTVRDITERKRGEARVVQVEKLLLQSEKMEAIGQLAGGIAHDFNNILTGIIGFTSMSKRHAKGNPVLENNLARILAASYRAKHLTQQILLFSRQSVQEKAVIDLKPIVTEVLDLLKASIPSSVGITADLQPDVKPVLADATKIHEVILNLVANAVHAMGKKGTLTVRLHAECLDQLEHLQTGDVGAGEYSVIEVTDTGCGMDAAVLSRAFEPFFTTKSVGEGTGMGLSVALGVVQSSGGNIRVASVVGKGTTFTIYLPVAEGPAAVAQAGEVKPGCEGAERVLFVDDEQMLLDMAGSELAYLGYKVTCMSNGRDALEFIRSHKSEIDILITDQAMPGLTGIELAQEALKYRTDLPVILCTGFSSTINPETARESGVRQVVLKPYEIHDISTLIRRIMDNRKREV